MWLLFWGGLLLVAALLIQVSMRLRSEKQLRMSALAAADDMRAPGRAGIPLEFLSLSTIFEGEGRDEQWAQFVERDILAGLHGKAGIHVFISECRITLCYIVATQSRSYFEGTQSYSSLLADTRGSATSLGRTTSDSTSLTVPMGADDMLFVSYLLREQWPQNRN